MLTAMAVHGYRSLRDVVLPLGRLTVVTGANGTGKSSLYAALQLLAGTASGTVVPALARSGGLESVLWAGPEVVSRRMQLGEVPVQGTGGRRRPVSLMLGFTTDDLGYLVDLGLPALGPESRFTLFGKDPILKREAVWAGPVMRPASLLVRRANHRVQTRDRTWQTLTEDLGDRESMLGELADPHRTPELLALRRMVRGWRFHDSFRTDATAPARQPQVLTWTPVMADDGSDFVPAVQTVLESAWAPVFRRAVAAAFPGGEVSVVSTGRTAELSFTQEGLLRPLSAAELSDGTLRYLLLATALCSPRPASLLVLNEPETSLHPDVLPGLADLVAATAQRTQVLVVSHSGTIVERLRSSFRAEAAASAGAAAAPDRSSARPATHRGASGTAPSLFDDPDDADQHVPGAAWGTNDLDASDLDTDDLDDVGGHDREDDVPVPGAGFVHHHLVKRLGETLVDGQGLLSRPTWDWGSR